MSDIDLSAWVHSVANPSERQFRAAVHTIALAFASHQALCASSFLKGGILLALRYRSPRHTTDMDFSTPRVFTEALAAEIRGQLQEGLAIAVDQLPYNLDCRLQSWRIEPKSAPPDSAWVTMTMVIAYGYRGTASHSRLARGHGSDVVEVEYSFLERVPSSDSLDIDAPCQLQVYGFSTIIAEKLRALLQQPSRKRYRRQDIYDLNRLLGDEEWSEEFRAETLDILKCKAGDRGITATAHSFDDPEIYRRAKHGYHTLADDLGDEELPDFDSSFEKVRGFYASLPWSRPSTLPGISA